MKGETLSNDEFADKEVYEVIGRVSVDDNFKKLHVQATSENEAMDYVSMFHNISEIKSITLGDLKKGIFYPKPA